MFFASLSRLTGAFVLVALSVTTASAAVMLRIDGYDRADLATAQSALAAYQNGTDGFAGPGKQVTGIRTETFAGDAAWSGTSGTSNPAQTNVGGFTALGGHGTGGSAIAGGTALQVRNDNPFFWGRMDTSGGGNWLDSNDTYGMKWDIGGPTTFNSVAFLLSDVADVGAKFSIKVGDMLYSNILGADGRLGNGSIQLVRILLDEAVTSLAIELRHDRLNDGFGIDGATVANIVPIPLPPAAALLLTGLAAIAGLRRRRGAPTA